jgi:predicted transcriptional regulator of viral defense system
MQMKSQDSENKLFEVAESQQGYFTSRQAKASGYKDNTHPYHVRSGHWIRVHRGIYRLAKFPRSERPDLMIWALWSSNRAGKIEGVYSHQTALSIHGLSDVLPDKLHMTVPLSFRRNSAIPKILVIYHKQLSQDKIVLMDGYFVTTPYQTLLDVIAEAHISHDLILQAVKAASDRGIVTQTMIKQLLNEKSVQSSPIHPFLKGSL